MIRLEKLTEEEISDLPFPETARKLGGLLVVESEVDPELVDRLRSQWRSQMITYDESSEIKFQEPEMWTIDDPAGILRHPIATYPSYEKAKEFVDLMVRRFRLIVKQKRKVSR